MGNEYEKTKAVIRSEVYDEVVKPMAEELDEQKARADKFEKVNEDLFKYHSELKAGKWVE